MFLIGSSIGGFNASETKVENESLGDAPGEGFISVMCDFGAVVADCCDVPVILRIFSKRLPIKLLSVGGVVVGLLVSVSSDGLKGTIRVSKLGEAVARKIK